MNEHERCLGRAQDHFAGRLSAAENAEFLAHGDRCPDCSAVLRRWPHAAAVPDALPAVRAALGWPSPSRLRRERGAWWWSLASLLALGLAVSAFWRPERQWARDAGRYLDTCTLSPERGQTCCED